jgi:unsaturated chondroitin disaccharide hydrolase
MIDIDFELDPGRLLAGLERLWALSADKLERIERSYAAERGAPVFTAQGRYQSRGWTEWTQGFQYGSLILQFDATNDERFLELGRERVVTRMASHLTHTGVHDHGFNNVSTYGNLLRLMGEGRIPFDRWERRFYELGLQVSGAVQASRWTSLRCSREGKSSAEGGSAGEAGGAESGYIYSFNGPHSLFVDTIRSCRALMLSHLLGHSLHAESDRRISLAERALTHLCTTARYSVFYGEGRDAYDVRGRTAHESLFNVSDGSFRCPSTQQGYSPFSTWTRGLAWAICGFAEELELLAPLPDATFELHGGRGRVTELLSNAARATADFYIDNTPRCGVPYWDTGAPGLAELERPLERYADPFNPHEPVDSSAAAIAAQGLLRLGAHLGPKGEGRRYQQAGLSVLRTLLGEPYVSLDPEHQGLLLHSVYHRPNGWDYLPPGSRTPRGEASMWGDYHLREVALYVQRLARHEPYHTFFSGIGGAGVAASRAGASGFFGIRGRSDA